MALIICSPTVMTPRLSFPDTVWAGWSPAVSSSFFFWLSFPIVATTVNSVWRWGIKPNLWSSVYADRQSPLRRCKPCPSTSPWPDLHLPNFVSLRRNDGEPTETPGLWLVQPMLFTLWVVACLHYIAGSATLQIPSDVFFSYNKVFFFYIAHCLIQGDFKKKSKQKKVETNNFYVQIPPSTEFGPPSFFFFCFATPTNQRRNIKVHESMKQLHGQS